MNEIKGNSEEKILNLSNNNSKFNYSLKNEEIILLIMDFLKKEGYDRTYVSLEEESGINLYNYDENLGILRGFILDGDWEEAEKSLEIFKNKKNFPYKNLIFEIRKEKLIEEVESQQKDGTFDSLAKELKDLQDLGCNKEFNTLMDYLKETEHDTLNETISRRLEIFNKIRKQITFQYPITENELNIKPNKLKEIFSKLIEKFISFGKIKNNNNIYSLKEIDNFLKIKIEQDIGSNQLDTDTNKNTIIHNSIYNYKDSFRITENDSNNYSEKNKNKSKNGSRVKKQKTYMERLAETYDDLDLYIQYEEIDNKKDAITKNFSDKKGNKKNSDKKRIKINSDKKGSKNNSDKKINKNNKSKNKVKNNINNQIGSIRHNNNYIKKYINNQNPKNKSKEKKKNTPKKDKNLETNENVDEINININTNNNNYVYIKNNDNDLSDLDQDEYFLKNCYDYYNYDITSLSLKKVIEDSHPIRCCCFSPKGEYFAIGTNSKCLKIYDLSNILDNFTKRNYIYSQLNNNNNNAKSLLSNSKLNKETIGMIFEQKDHHYGSIFCIDWSSSGKLLATGSNDKTIKIMNVPELDEKNNKSLTGNQGTVRSLCFEPSNDLILLSANTGENTIKIWDTIKGINITCLEGHNSDVNSVKWSNDSQLFASCSLDKTIRFWDIRDYKYINILSAEKYADINDISIFSKGNNTIIAVGHADGLVTIWDYSKQCVIKEIYEHNEEVRAVSFSPDGKYLLSGSFDSTIKIYDINDNFSNIWKLEHGDKVVSCKWHPEIPLIVSTSADKTARVWVPSKY